MLKLTVIMFILVGTTLAGSFVVAALTMNMFDATSISLAAAAGALVAIPVSWLIAKKLNTVFGPA